jgi:uncharacterized protein (DUF433 family)
VAQQASLPPAQSLTRTIIKAQDLDDGYWSECLAVERDPQKLSGAWIFRGTRLTLQTLFDNLDAGASVRDI